MAFSVKKDVRMTPQGVRILHLLYASGKADEARARKLAAEIAKTGESVNLRIYHKILPHRKKGAKAEKHKKEKPYMAYSERITF